MPEDANEPGLLVLEACYLQMPLHIIYITDYERQKRKLKSNLMAQKNEFTHPALLSPMVVVFFDSHEPQIEQYNDHKKK